MQSSAKACPNSRILGEEIWRNLEKSGSIFNHHRRILTKKSMSKVAYYSMIFIIIIITIITIITIIILLLLLFWKSEMGFDSLSAGRLRFVVNLDRGIKSFFLFPLSNFISKLTWFFFLLLLLLLLFSLLSSLFSLPSVSRVLIGPLAHSMTYVCVRCRLIVNRICFWCWCCCRSCLCSRNNGSLPTGDKGRKRSKYTVTQRPEPNGVQPANQYRVQTPQTHQVKLPPISYISTFEFLFSLFSFMRTFIGYIHTLYLPFTYITFIVYIHLYLLQFCMGVFGNVVIRWL